MLPGLGRGQRRLDGLLVAHLTDEDHVGVLAQHPAQRALERGGVHADLALVDHRAYVGVDELDRILDRDDVLAHRAVHVVDHRRERRRLPRAGGACEQHDPALLLGQFAHHRGQRELLDRADVVRDRPTRHRDHAALLEGVDAVARSTGDFEGEVDLVLLREFGELDLVAQQRSERALGVIGAQRLDALVDRQLTVDTVERRRADLQVQIRALSLDELPQRSLDVEHAH
jgi:hypothetical protein